MKILVTGGAGFIGSNCVRYLLENHPDDSIVNLDKLTYAGNLDNLRGIGEDTRHRFVRGDICDEALVDRLAMETDAIIHFAAETHVDRSIVASDDFIQTNVMGTHRLLEASRKHHHRRFLHISTDEVYGSCLEGDFNEDAPLSPSSPYSASKASSDLLVLSYYKTYGLPAIITRCSNNYGPYQFPEKLIPLMITNALEDQPLPLYGDGLYVRDWLYVRDHCEAIDRVFQDGKQGEIYNIGAEGGRTNLEIIQAILKTLGKPQTLIRHVKDRPAHDRRYAVNPKKIQTELGWQPAFSLEDALKKTIEWYCANQTWWRSVKSGEYLQMAEKIYGAVL
ncbi:MAG: dTDP-glucose 4,6-dehydratase [Nitrospiria bacterium]